MHRPDLQRLATLSAVLPAPMLLVSRHLHGGALGLSEEFWRGAVLGLCLTLQAAAVGYLLLNARAACSPKGSDKTVEKRRGESEPR